MNPPEILDAAARLRAAGLRVTDSRRAVVEALIERPHASADELFGIVARTIPGTSLQSVYNALSDFVDAGLARRIEPAGRPGLFELRVDDNHHHLVCSECGAVQDVDCVVGDAPCLTPSDAHGYAVQVAEVTFWGVCPSCAAARADGGEIAARVPAAS
ncbi:Fur family transcriptional regulator [Microbacterium sp. ZW T2_14]|uniref:Fur family transcriptional regulator n=1 Tax=Microbacterium sp. ZW T2_14 TaxID=3378079 RepID=UPI003853C597